MNKSSRKRLNIDRKVVGILSFVAILGVCLIFLIVFATNSISALRSYSPLQTFWTEARKDASSELIQYIHTADSENMRRYQESMQRIEAATKTRIELVKDAPDMNAIHQYLQMLNVRPVEIDNMVSTYQTFQSFPVFQRSIRNWSTSDSLVYQYNNVAEQARRSAIADAQLLNRVETLDEHLDRIQYQLAHNLGKGAALLNSLIIGTGIVLGTIFLFISGILLIRFKKSIEQWSHEISESRQRYRSLFRQNPHAVFSMDNDGYIQNGNEAFYTLFGNGTMNKSIEHFFDILNDASESKIESKLQKVQAGKPCSFESGWENGSQNHLTVHITLMPILVDHTVTGVYGIAEDVTYERNAEQKIKQQLEEKTVLLSEIHHRVKNNLAIISGLLDLQQDSLRDEAAVSALAESKMRIQSIAMIHEKIYQNDTLAAINVRNYIEELTEMIARSFDLHGKKIALHLDIKDIAITLDQSIPCGLIINELICNAYEHAFEKRDEGNIWISLTGKGENVNLRIADDGSGLPDHLHDNQAGSLGLTLVETLTQQLEGTLVVKKESHTVFEIMFTKEKVQQDL